MLMEVLYKNQKELDLNIIKTNNICEKETDLLTKKFLAALVELGEFAEEIKDRVKALYEYVDTLHFLLSINNDLELNYMCDIEFESIYNSSRFELDATRSGEIVDFIMNFTNLANATRCFKYWSTKKSEDKNRLKDLYAVTLWSFFSIGNFEGYTADEIIEAYKTKRLENFKRQQEGY